MPKYAYKAMNKEGKEAFGIVESENQALAINDIRQMGLYPTKVYEARKSDERRARKEKGGLNELYFGGVKTKELVIMTRQLSTLIDAGLPLLRSINVLIAQLKPSKLRDILREIRDEIQSGSTFSEGLAKHPKEFDRLYVNMVRAGEVGGMLEVVLQRLATFMERRQALKRRVKSAMVYPVAVLLVAVGIVWFLLSYVVPEFAVIFEDFGAKLPWMTQFLIKCGDFARFEWWKVALYFNGTIITIKVLSKIHTVKRITDRVVLRIPLVGDLITKVAVARFSRTLGTLITSGVPILQSLRITKETIGNEVIENAIQKVHDSIKEGDTIAAPLDESKVFPPMVVNMIDVGEETGSLDAMLMKVADIYDAEVEAAVEALLALMEPVMIVVLGVICGFIVISMYLPIFSLADVMSGV
ncbi:MAG TPA: type II secretion system inner membrane protein GspF [Candidatus Hydrogenedentes bacterium]|nr:type II secretion system inner membrane protein GspF [Candidatus Hydrogenedentota bacterium]MDY0033790.1 type II secretion system inner membrane protein GspF [FCB group bacterium]HNZ18103.1 type II secretion system inner membrane protein GspF [Candidatus Hydrogenedentota bacterium]HOH32393.1 type II secretion system inner membrane protein GspF [Candidatus Hydrogenedentota bacterium]HPV35912.1 type II secretion system inner membrane protein GspF [Candidatus Hydrogenedentota bacterium]